VSGEFNFHELKASDRLPTPSGTAVAIMRLLQRENVTAQDVAQRVQTDPALTGRLLRLANSPLAGARRPVASVMDAVVLVGMKVVRQFALSLSLVGDHQHGQCRSFDYQAYWSRSLAMAAAIQAVAAQERSVAPEEAFTLGLLADVGRLALATAWPEEYGECLLEAEGEALLALENERFAIDREALSVMLLEDWGFPAVFLDALIRSNKPAAPSDDSRASRFARQLVFARAIAGHCLADEARRASLAPGLNALAATQSLDENALRELLGRIESQWREWGALIGVATDIRQSDPPSPPAVAEASGNGGERLEILLVDDDSLMLARLSKHLKMEGYNVVALRDGEAALAYALEREPRMIVTDWRMQPMDGLQLCKSLRCLDFGKSLYIIMLTADESEDALVQAFDAGMDDYVVKPPSMKVLTARIRAGRRIIGLQQKLEREHREIERFSAELAVANRRLELMAYTDQLTELPNRRYAMGRLEQEWTCALRFARPLSVMILDLDRFKSINDSLGHDAGDRVLAHAAKVMRASVRASDIVCRLGGEEFLVIALNTDGAAALQSAERIRLAIESRQPEGLALSRPLTVSVGVASGSGPKPDWKELIKMADQALYQAKESGRNRVRLVRSLIAERS
jgi:diguanylate cyclase (GGDEF)-like protein